jgi:hypothetical protein
MGSSIPHPILFAGSAGISTELGNNRDPPAMFAARRAERSPDPACRGNIAKAPRSSRRRHEGPETAIHGSRPAPQIREMTVEDRQLPVGILGARAFVDKEAERSDQPRTVRAAAAVDNTKSQRGEPIYFICHCEEPTGPRYARPEDKLRDDAISATYRIRREIASPGSSPGSQ